MKLKRKVKTKPKSNKKRFDSSKFYNYIRKRIVRGFKTTDSISILTEDYYGLGHEIDFDVVLVGDNEPTELSLSLTTSLIKEICTRPDLNDNLTCKKVGGYMCYHFNKKSKYELYNLLLSLNGYDKKVIKIISVGVENIKLAKQVEKPFIFIINSWDTKRLKCYFETDRRKPEQSKPVVREQSRFIEDLFGEPEEPMVERDSSRPMYNSGTNELEPLMNSRRRLRETERDARELLSTARNNI